MFTLMQPGRPATTEPPRPIPTPAEAPGFPRAGPGKASAEQDDWPADVHLPDENEEDEC